MKIAEDCNDCGRSITITLSHRSAKWSRLSKNQNVKLCLSGYFYSRDTTQTAKFTSCGHAFIAGCKLLLTLLLGPKAITVYLKSVDNTESFRTGA